MSIYVMHMLSGPDGTARCGAADPGPVRWGKVRKVIACVECMTTGPTGLPREATLGYHLEELRTELRTKLEAMSEAERADWKESIFSAALASLADPEAAPPLYSTSQVLAALYALSSARAGLYQFQRAGGALSFAMVEESLHTLEIIIVALAEGMPQ